MNLSDSLKSLFIETAQTLKGHARRRFMAQIVNQLGAGGQRRAERRRRGMAWKERPALRLPGSQGRGNLLVPLVGVA